VRIDKAGRHDQIGSVDLASGLLLDAADLNHFAAVNGDIRPIARAAATVHHRAVLYQ
jgi:hypothetical protein